MVTKGKQKRSDTVIRISRFLDEAIEIYLRSDKKIKIEFPNKRNFVDSAVLEFLKQKKVKV